ncbi:MAG: hypothetical protein WAW11_03530 [Patescibacteria group bacterium]
MAKLKKLINNYGEVLDFNHKVEEFFVENWAFLRKRNNEKYSQKTLLETMSGEMTVSVGLKIQGKLTLVENNNSPEGKKTEMIFETAEIHCVAEQSPEPIFFDFRIDLIIDNLIFPIAKNKEHYSGEVKTVSFNRKRKMISGDCQPILIFKYKKDFNNVLALCQRAVQLFNDHLPEDSKLIPNANL